MGDLRIKEIDIRDFEYPDLYRVGIVKVQMPEQCAGDGSFRIRHEERERNRSLVGTILSRFGGKVFSSGSPANFFVFPELSIGEETAELIFQTLKTDQIGRNTVIVFGLEKVNKDVFLKFLSESNSNGDFSTEQFGSTIRFVNTSVVLIKDKNSDLHTYFQPKISRSGYESADQFKSDLVYVFKFGDYRSIVSICSDLFVSKEGTPVLKSIMASLNEHVKKTGGNPRQVKIDFWFLLQKNKYPMGSLYTNSIRTLYFREGHDIDTNKTIVCSVNCALEGHSTEFRSSNVCVMDRGRAPDELLGRNSAKWYAWKTFERQGTDGPLTLRYIIWRLKGAGVIAFLLNTNDRPTRADDEPPVPIEDISVSEIVGADLVELSEHPEIYELKELLLSGFAGFINEAIGALPPRIILADRPALTSLLDSLFREPPFLIFEALMTLHEEKKRIVNCDHWDKDAALFHNFLLSLRLLGMRFDPLTLEGGHLRHHSTSIGLVDCLELTCTQLAEKESEIIGRFSGVSLVFLQRLKESNLWNGERTNMGSLFNKWKSTRAPSRPPNAASVASPRYPDILSLSYIVKSLNDCLDFGGNPPEKLEEIVDGCF